MDGMEDCAKADFFARVHVDMIIMDEEGVCISIGGVVTMMMDDDVWQRCALIVITTNNIASE